MPKKYNPYPGLKINKILVIEKINKKWKVKCDCGKVWITRIDYIFRKNQQSCGCSYKHKNGSDSHRWKGYGDIPKNIFDSIKIKAQERNYIFDITIEDMWAQYIKQDKKCNLSGLAIRFYKQTKLRNKITASLDRIDPKKGYTKDNIQIIHKRINIMKNDFTNEEFIRLCKIISQN